MFSETVGVCVITKSAHNSHKNFAAFWMITLRYWPFNEYFKRPVHLRSKFKVVSLETNHPLTLTLIHKLSSLSHKLSGD